jgi:hypothetical protein
MDQTAHKTAPKDVPSWAGEWETNSHEEGPNNDSTRLRTVRQIRRDDVMRGLLDLSVQRLSLPMTPQEKNSIGEFLNSNFDRIASYGADKSDTTTISGEHLVAAFRQDKWPDGKKLSNQDREMLRETALHFHEFALPGESPYAIDRSDVQDYRKGATVTSEGETGQTVRTARFPDGSFTAHVDQAGCVISGDGKGSVEATCGDMSLKLPKTGNGQLKFSHSSKYADIDTKASELTIPLEKASDGKWKGKFATGEEFQIAFDQKGATTEAPGLRVRGELDGIRIHDEEAGDSKYSKDAANLSTEEGKVTVTGDYSAKKVVGENGESAIQYSQLAYVATEKKGITISALDDERSAVPDVFVDHEGQVFLLNRDGSKGHQFAVNADGLADETLADGKGVTQNKDGSLTIRFQNEQGKREEWALASNGRLVVQKTDDDPTVPSERHTLKALFGGAEGGAYDAPGETKLDLVPQLAKRADPPK